MDLSSMSREQLEALVLRQQQATQRKLTLKVTEKGGLSVYGMGRFPVTLYKGQWERLLDHAVAIRQFMTDNANLLKDKNAA